MPMSVQMRIFAAAILVLLASGAGLTHSVSGMTAGLGLNPARIEVEINPGGEKTVGFRIESPLSDTPVQGRLMLSVTDWNIDERAHVSYADPGSQPNSASPWIIFSPGAINIRSGETHLVRVTAKVPDSARPGVYRTGIFVQERPPAAQANPGEHLLYFRFRYVFTLYVIVPPVVGKGELQDVRIVSDREGVALLYEMKNLGSRHVRPRLGWAIYDGSQREILSGKNKESTVLLPFAAMTVRVPIADSLLPGQYDLDAQVDFSDGGYIQAFKRSVQIPAGPEKPALASAIKR
jgi:P pilus assembly chaperone PapD